MERLYLCTYCNISMDPPGGYCQECKDRLAAYEETIPKARFPFVAGLSDGPDSGRGNNQKPVFCRPDPLRETIRSLRKSEDAGTMTKANAVAARAKVESLKAQEPFRKKVDYEKDGHPLEGMNT